MTVIEINAANKVLGRLATNIALLLRGKNTVGYRPDRLPDIKIIVHHADQVVLTGRKESQKNYYHFSGYPGGLSKRTASYVRRIHPDRLLRQAVKRMLPNNKLRSKLLNKLILETK